MASIAMNKLKSKLTTRNQFTGKAMDRMTKENLRELFQGDLNYMSWEKTYLQRRFHPEQHLEEIRKHRRELIQKQKENSPNSQIDYDALLLEEEKHDIELQKRFKQFSELHNGDKPILILDVDNTMVYVRFFSEEMQVNDIVTYFGAESVSKNNGKVVEVRLTLSLEISHNALIDKVGAERMIFNYWAQTNEMLKKYKKKNGVFQYEMDGGEMIGCKIRKVEVTGCRVTVEDLSEVTEIDFTNGNENLSKLEPMLERPGMCAVDFIFEGFLIRLRPNLDEFLEYCADDYDVVIYTSANKLIYEGMLEVLHEYVKDQLGREDEEDLTLWSDVLYRDDCTLDYNERGKPYHHKDLTLFGCDLSRVIMIDNSPIVCRGEEPNFILIKDYFGKDNMDDELMEVYQMLDAMVEIEGDVRYFLCGLDNEQTETLDLSTEDSCWECTEELMKELDAYYSEQIALSPISVGYVTEEEEAFMDDYDDEDIDDREKMYSMHASPITHDEIEEINQTNEDGKDEESVNTVNTVNTVKTMETRVSHSPNSTVASVKEINSKTDTEYYASPASERKIETMKKSPYGNTQVGTEPNTPNTQHLHDASVSTITITSIEDENGRNSAKKKSKVSFATPSLNTNAIRDQSYSLSQSQKSQSAKSGRYRNYSLGVKKSQSARFKKGQTSAKDHFKRNKSLLLDPQKLQNMTQKRHVRYSSMSPRYGYDLKVENGSKPSAAKHKLSFNDLSLNDAIHSFGAVDTDDDEDEDHSDSAFFSAKQLHEHTKSSLTIDSKRYSLKQKKTEKIPIYNDDAGQSVDDAKEEKKETEDDDEFLEDGFIPAPNFNKRRSMKTLDQIKATKSAIKQKRLSQKRASKINLQTPTDIYSGIDYDALKGKRKKGKKHRRGLSSDAIGNIDFVTDTGTPTQRRPGQKGHKLSIANTEQFGKVWRNTMAPRPTAKAIVNAQSSKHDEFILLFQRQLNDIKREQIQSDKRKRSHVNNMEKRKSLPDFAMLSENSDANINAHRMRLDTLKEEQINIQKSMTLESVNEKHTIDVKTLKVNNNTKYNNTESKEKLLSDDGNNLNKVILENKLITEWDENISVKHGCCYYFCCCCICNLFTHRESPKNNPMKYSPT